MSAGLIMAGFRLPFGGRLASDRSHTGDERAGQHMSIRKKKSGAEKGVTLIAANTEVAGDVHFVNQLYINGHIKGNITADVGSDATVVVSEEGSVAGEIRVPNVVVNGRVEGNVYATSRMELARNAEVKGNVYYKLIEMQLGAMVDGQLVHDETLGAETPNVHPFPETPESASSRD
jgi:cytoskeletal protein CcmA (bactofilin family)